MQSGVMGPFHRSARAALPGVGGILAARLLGRAGIVDVKAQVIQRLVQQLQFLRGEHIRPQGFGTLPSRTGSHHQLME